VGYLLIVGGKLYGIAVGERYEHDVAGCGNSVVTRRLRYVTPHDPTLRYDLFLPHTLPTVLQAMITICWRRTRRTHAE